MWNTNDDKIEALLLDTAGKPIADPVLVDATPAYGSVGVAATLAGVVVAWGADGGIRTALLDAKERVARAASPVGRGMVGADCALAPMTGGLGLVFAAMGEHTETSALRFAPLDARGLATGPAAIVSSGHGFLRAPTLARTPAGGLVIGASGPFAREVVLVGSTRRAR